MQPSEPSAPEPGPNLEVRLLPILAVLAALALVSVGLLSLMNPASALGEDEPFFRAVAMVLVLLGALLLVAAVGLWGYRPWGWWLSVTVDVAYILLLVAVQAVRPSRDPIWFVGPAVAGAVLLWLYLVRRDFGVDVATASPPPA